MKFFEVIGTHLDFLKGISPSLSFLNRESVSSSRSSSNDAMSIARDSLLSSSALWKQSLFLASRTRSFHMESLLTKVAAFPTIQRQYLH